MFCRRFVHVEGVGDEFGSFPKASARTWDRFTPSCVSNVSALADLATSACGHVNPHQSESSDTARPNLNAREVCAMFSYDSVWKKGIAARACHTHCRLSGPCTSGRDIFLENKDYQEKYICGIQKKENCWWIKIIDMIEKMIQIRVLLGFIRVYFS